MFIILHYTFVKNDAWKHNRGRFISFHYSWSYFINVSKHFIIVIKNKNKVLARLSKKMVLALLNLILPRSTWISRVSTNF